PLTTSSLSVHTVSPPLTRLSRRFLLNATATTEISPLSLHDALPIWRARPRRSRCRNGERRIAPGVPAFIRKSRGRPIRRSPFRRSEEHTSELQSLTNLVCRLLLEKKNNILDDTTQLPPTTPPLHALT